MNVRAPRALDGSRSRATAPGRGRLVSVLLVAAVLPYAGVLDAPFVFDDVKLVRDNSFLRAAAMEPALVLDTFDITSRRWDDEELRPNYRPLRFLSYLIDYKLSQWWFGSFAPEELPSFFFHLSNVLFHAVGTLLVFAIATSLLGQLLRPASRPAPSSSSSFDDAGAAEAQDTASFAWFGGLAAGLVFALHPLETEAVTYVSGRRDVLSTCFFLGALWLAARRCPGETPGWWTLAAVPALFAAGLLTKEMVITLAPVLLLVDWVRGARWSAPRLLLHAILWALTFAFIIATLRNERLVAAAGAHDGEVIPLTACRYLLRYLGLVLWPVSQTVDYSYRVIPASTGLLSPWTTLPAALLAGGLVLAGVASLATWVRGDARRACGWRSWTGLLSLGVLWFAGTLVPVLQLVPIAERFAERVAYLPSIGLVLLAGGAFHRLRARRERLGTALLVVLCLVLLGASVRRNEAWKSPLNLWSAAVDVAPECARAHFGRGHALKAAGRLHEAAEEYSRALELFREKPDIPLHHGYILQALTLRGGVCGQLGRTEPELLEQAIRHYREVLGSTDTDGTPIGGSPRHTAVQFDLAQYLVLADRKSEAIEEYRRVIEIGSPASLVGSAHYYLGKITLLETMTREEGLRSLRAAYETLPVEAPQRYQVAAELADLYIDDKKLDEAAGLVDDALEDAREHARGGAEEPYLLLRRAKILDRRGQLSATVEILHQILARDPDSTPALISLAVIEANLGEIESAESRYRRVLEREPGNQEAHKGLRMLLLRSHAAETPDSPDGSAGELAALERKGLEHLERVELTAAREVFATLLEAAKRQADDRYRAIALRGLGGVEARLGRLANARTYLETALEIEPGNAATLLRLGDLTLRRFDDKEAARGYYLRYLDALAGGEAPQARVHVTLAQLTMDANAAAALEHCFEARSLGYDVPVLDATLGHVYSRLGEWEKSLDAFNRYLEREFDDAKKEEARRYVREAVLPNL